MINRSRDRQGAPGSSHGPGRALAVKPCRCPALVPFLALLLWILACPARAQFTTSIDAGAVTITGYTGPGGALLIPETIAGLPVTAIAASAFNNNIDITGVTIPDSLASIGNNAFYGCLNLSSVEIGDGVTKIGNLAFGICSSLNSLTIGNSVAEVGSSAFIDCTGLESVTLPESLVTIGAFAFYNCGLRSITIPDSVITIGDLAFSSCNNMLDAAIGNGVTSIGTEAFRDCANMTLLTIGGSVASIGNSAFRECYSLGAITIPASVTTIGYGAFLDCASLTEFVVEEASADFRSVEGVLCDKNTTTIIVFPRAKGGSYTTPETVRSLGTHGFRNCEYLTSLTIGDNVTSIGDADLEGCSRLTSISFGNGLTGLGAFSFSSLPVLTSVIIGDGVTRIEAAAFTGCSSLTGVIIGSGVTAIGASAFEDCENLASVTIGSGVTTIGDGGFYRCSRLRTVYFYGNAPSLGAYAFLSLAADARIYHLPGTTGWPPLGSGFGGYLSFPGYPTALGPFTYTTADGEITITSYSGSGGIVRMPNTIVGLPVTAIGERAFEETSPAQVIIPASVTSIGEQAFASCTSLTGFTVNAGSASFRSVEGVLFDGSLATLVSFPAGLGGSYAIPDSVSQVENGAFVGCGSLTGFTVGSANSSYRSDDGVLLTKDLAVLVAFPGGLGGIYRVPEGVSTISNHAFRLCGNLTAVGIPPSVTGIGSHAFADCGSLVRLIFDGSPPGLGSPDSSVFLGVAPGATIYHKLADGWPATFGGLPTVLGLLSYMTNAGEITISAYRGFGGAVNIPDTIEGLPVTRIGDSALGYNNIITSITIPASVTSISYGAFTDCTSLTDLYFKGNAPDLGYAVLDGLVGVTIHYLAGTTGWEAFEGLESEIWVLPQSTAIVSPGITEAQFGFVVIGPGSHVVVEVTNDLDKPGWKPLATLTLSGGSADFADPEWTGYRNRFYRVRLP